jgi:hypothetical protein
MPRQSSQGSARSVSQMCLHISPPQVIDNGEGATFKHTQSMTMRPNVTTKNITQFVIRQIPSPYGLTLHF